MSWGAPAPQVPCYRFVPSVPLTEAAIEAVEAVPGARVFGRGHWAGTILAPIEVGWLIEKTLDAHGIPFGLHAPPARPQVTWEQFADVLRARGEATEEAISMTLPFQREALERHATIGDSGSLMLQAGGSGKTLQLILLSLYLTPPPQPIVIVTRAAARQQWADQVRRFTGHRVEPYVIRPLPKRLAKRPRKTPPENLDEYVARKRAANERIFVLVAWGSIPAYLSQLQAFPPSFLGMDEVHDQKGFRRVKKTLHAGGRETWDDLGNRASASAKLSASAWARAASTATLVKDRVRDVWAPYDLVRPGAAGYSSRFMKRYAAAREKNYGGMDTEGESNLDELRARLGFFAVIVPFDVSHAALLGMKRRESWYLGLEDCGVGWSATRFRAEMKKAAQAGNSPSALLEVQVAATSAMKRDPLVARILDEIDSYGGAGALGVAADKKAAVGCKITVLDIRHESVELLALALRKARGHLDVFCVHGGNTTPEKREQVRQLYMKHLGPCVLVATGDSVGTSYDLHDTDLGFFSGLPWNGGELHQREARWFRLGMRRHCRVVFCIVRGTVDERFVSRIIAKLPAMEKVTGDVETGSAAAALGGTDDPEAIIRDILAELASVDADLLED